MAVSTVTLVAALLSAGYVTEAFITAPVPPRPHSAVGSTAADASRIKNELLNLLRVDPTQQAQPHPIYCDPVTKEALYESVNGGGGVLGVSSAERTYRYQTKEYSSEKYYKGSSRSYINLLEPCVVETDAAAATTPKSNGQQQQMQQHFRSFVAPFIPPPLLSNVMQMMDSDESSYVPMRDLFTSPLVSYAYERGWRQGFQQAGFPGADVEAALAMEYFSKSTPNTVVDMSCATGLFARRFAKSYDTVLACDYSDSMLKEARRRYDSDTTSSGNCEFVRLDVGAIPFRNDTIPALHAGAAMHCWPDVEASLKEIHRVLAPGGRFFATTFLSRYFRTLQQNGSSSVQQQAFQYFESVEEIRKIAIAGGFDPSKVRVELLPPACIIVRAEK